jgi:hypothetical protein
MSDRIDPSWSVLESIETPDASRCVDVFARGDGTFGFEAFRRDPEDRGKWTGIEYFSVLTFASRVEALEAARDRLAWLDDQLGGRESPS